MSLISDAHKWMWYTVEGYSAKELLKMLNKLGLMDMRDIAGNTMIEFIIKLRSFSVCSTSIFNQLENKSTE